MSRATGWPATVVVGVVAGLAAARVKSWAEPRLQAVGERFLPPAPGAKDRLGADIEDPETMPPAVLADRVARRARGRELGDDERSWAMGVMHHSFGAGAGAAYAVAAAHDPRVTVGSGAAAGAVLWLATHGSTLPLAGLQGRPDEMPRAWWVWELGSHLVFGVAVELLRRSLLRAVAASPIGA